jgi:hypothetical protein
LIGFDLERSTNPDGGIVSAGSAMASLVSGTHQNRAVAA